MSSYGVVSALVAPQLKDVTKPDLIKFEIECTAYKEKVADINRSRDTVRRISPTSIRQCLNPVLLQSLCLLGQIEGAATASQATDAKVKAWFDARLVTAPEELTERVPSVLDSVKFECNKRDPSDEALSFIVKVVSALDESNASEVIQDKETCTFLIWKLISKLERPELRERIRDARDCWTSEEKSSLSFFQSRVRTIAVEVAQGGIARHRLNKQGNKRNRTPDKRDDKKKNPPKKSGTGFSKGKGQGPKPKIRQMGQALPKS